MQASRSAKNIIYSKGKSQKRMPMKMKNDYPVIDSIEVFEAPGESMKMREDRGDFPRSKKKYA